MVYILILETLNLGKGDMLTGFEPSMILSLNSISDFDMIPGLVGIIWGLIKISKFCISGK